MCVTVGKNKVIMDYSSILEFCKAVDKAAAKANYIYLEYDGGHVSLFAEGLASYACLRMPATKGQAKFTAGVSADHFIKLVKRLYEGDVELKLDKAKLKIKKGNINASLAVMSRKAYVAQTEGSDLPQEHVPWFVDSLSSVLAVDESLKNSGIQFPGILFDNSKGASRICKFSRTTLALRSGKPIFGAEYRVVLQDELAMCAKMFGPKVETVFLAPTGVGLRMAGGTEVFFSLMNDKYPKEYISQWGLKEGVKLVADEEPGYVFPAGSLMCAADLVSAVLGDLDHFIIFSIVGNSGEDLVWQVEGKSFDGTHVTEKVTSTSGPDMASFQLNKKSFLKVLGSFTEDIRVCDINPSLLALANSDGSAVALLSKAAI